jgi:hypothetical protein
MQKDLSWVPYGSTRAVLEASSKPFHKYHGQQPAAIGVGIQPMSRNEDVNKTHRPKVLTHVPGKGDLQEALSLTETSNAEPDRTARSIFSVNQCIGKVIVKCMVGL